MADRTAADAASPQAASSGSVARLHWIDWLRVAAIIGVFLYHTMRPFNDADWHVKNAEQSAGLGIAMGVFWSFGLAILFLISGAGVRFALRRRTWRTFLRERTTRLMIPFFVAGVLILSPIQAFIEASHKGPAPGPFLDFTLSWYGQTLNPLDWPFSPTIFGGGYHLWFLGFLFAFSVIALPLFVGLLSPRGRPIVEALARSVSWPGGSLVFAVPIVILMSIGVFLGIAEHDWFEFLWYLTYFVIGFLFVSDDRFLAGVRRDFLPAAGVAVASTATLTLTPAADLLLTLEGGLDVPHVLAGVVFGLEGWAWTLVILNVGMRVARLQLPVPPRVGEAVLPVYVLHQPVILAVAFFVVAWPLGIGPKWLAVLVVSAAITLALVELGLRVGLTRVVLGARAQPSAAIAVAPAAAPSLDPMAVGEPWPRAPRAEPRHARSR